MKKILIVDDSPAWRVFHKNNIEELFLEADIEDYVIDLAISGREGYDELIQNEANPYDLIVTDLQMEDDFTPKLAGEWFVEQVQTFDKYFNTKIIISSGMYNIKHIAEKYNTDYIPKRVAVADINLYKETIANALGIELQ